MGTLFNRMFGSPVKSTEGAQPRLLGHAEPHYDFASLEFFSGVAMASHPPLFGERSEADRRTLATARELGLLYCNTVLHSNLVALVDAATAFDQGEIPMKELDRIRDHFLSRCRLALGTND